VRQNSATGGAEEEQEGDEGEVAAERGETRM
jgi:hypothetical protein